VCPTPLQSKVKKTKTKATTIRNTPKPKKSNSYNELAGKYLKTAIDTIPEVPNRRAIKPYIRDLNNFLGIIFPDMKSDTLLLASSLRPACSYLLGLSSSEQSPSFSHFRRGLLFQL
jgi:hypothetical protein